MDVWNILIFPVILQVVLSLDSGEMNNCREWPSDDVMEIFDAQLDGRVVYGKDIGNAGDMNNIRFSTYFGIVVYAQNIDDIVKAVKFAAEHKMPLSVLSTGHEYVGRNAEPNTFHISLREMTDMVVDESDPASDTGYSITVQTGSTWGDIFREVDRYGKLVVGGSDPSVGPGGYFLGGGHSPLTPKLGLGIDGLLAIKMVTVTGDVLEVNETDVIKINDDGSTSQVANSDLWWALRGGGPGLGVIVSYKIKMHNPPAGFVQFYVLYPLILPNGVDISTDVLDAYAEVFSGLSNNWGGFLLSNNYPWEYAGEQYTGQLSISMLHYGVWADAKADIDALNAITPQYLIYQTAANFTSFWDYQKNVNADYGGSRQYIGNRFLVRDDFLKVNDRQTNITSIISSLKKISYPMFGACTGVVLQGIEAGSDDSAVTPDFRSGRMSLTCGTGWDKEKDDHIVEEIMHNWFEENLYPYGSGVYFNEPDDRLTDWKRAYWHSEERYNRLLSVKQTYDADLAFACPMCVGSSLSGGDSYPGELKMCTAASTGHSIFASVAPFILMSLAVVIS